MYKTSIDFGAFADYGFLQFDQITVAAAIVARAREVQGIENIWTNDCLQMSSLVFEDIRNCYDLVTALDQKSASVASDDFESLMTLSPKSVCSLATSFSFSKVGGKRAVD